MNYRTTCPHCASVFRLGTDQLNAAQGWAQCGVCGAAFDARPSLLMEDGSPLPAAPQPKAAPAPQAPELPPPAAEAAPPSPPANPFVVSEPEAAPEIAAPAIGIAQRQAEPGLDSIIIIDPDVPVPDDFDAMPQFDADAAPASPAPLMYPPPAAVADAPEKPTRRERAEPPPAPDAESLEELLAPRRSRSRGWGVASVLLAALLLAQSAFFLRDTLASRLPQTRPALERMCAALGCTLSLPKNLALLQIVGSDLQTEAGDQLRLSLTLGNRASHAQAWPVLVLTLTDQRDRPMARRSFAPSEYLEDSGRIAAGIPPRSEQALSLPLAVHDLAPMGFDLQLAY